MTNLEYLGVAERYPFDRNPATGGFYTVGGLDLLKQEIFIALETQLGSIFCQENMGSRFYLLKFEPNDTVLRGLLIYHGADAIVRCCPKIELSDVLVQKVNENQFNVGIGYFAKNSPEEQWLVYPFFKEVRA